MDLKGMLEQAEKNVVQAAEMAERWKTILIASTAQRDLLASLAKEPAPAPNRAARRKAAATAKD